MPRAGEAVGSIPASTSRRPSRTPAASAVAAGPRQSSCMPSAGRTAATCATASRSLARRRGAFDDEDLARIRGRPCRRGHLAQGDVPAQGAQRQGQEAIALDAEPIDPHLPLLRRIQHRFVIGSELIALQQRTQVDALGSPRRHGQQQDLPALALRLLPGWAVDI